MVDGCWLLVVVDQLELLGRPSNTERVNNGAMGGSGVCEGCVSEYGYVCMYLWCDLRMNTVLGSLSNCPRYERNKVKYSI